MAMTFAKPQLILLSGNKITDHNRSELAISVERIETATRMANGTMRKYWVADKRKFVTDWTQVPGSYRNTVDGFWGANDIEKFYNEHVGALELQLNYGEGKPELYTVVLSSFSKNLVKRGLFDMYDCSIELEEV